MLRSAVVSICAMVLLGVLGCASPGLRPPDENHPSRAALDRYLAAFNAHDAVALGECLAPDVEWISVEGSRVSVDGQGRDAIVAWCRKYFADLPSVRSEFVAMLSADGSTRFAAAIERPTWTGKDGTTRMQQSLAVFEFEGGLIRRVYYFPSERL